MQLMAMLGEQFDGDPLRCQKLPLMSISPGLCHATLNLSPETHVTVVEPATTLTTPAKARSPRIAVCPEIGSKLLVIPMKPELIGHGVLCWGVLHVMLDCAAAPVMKQSASRPALHQFERFMMNAEINIGSQDPTNVYCLLVLFRTSN